MRDYDRMLKLEDEIKKKQLLANQAQDKGLSLKYKNYLMDIMDLKKELNKLRTHPNRVSK